MPSVGSILGLAFADARADRKSTRVLDSELSPAQTGAALKAIELGVLEVQGASRVAVDMLTVKLKQRSLMDSLLPLYREQRFEAVDTLEQVVGHLFENPSDLNIALIGYWVATLFIRKVEGQEINALTKFLVGPPPPVVRHSQFFSVRRYPSGGISEKQALILPVLLKHFSERCGWRSDFLIAGLLSFTGGTRAKLSVVPGFHTFPPFEGDHETNGRPRIAYISASMALCPRDALLYRIRGETGTVVDQGLMASSIMSKQIAVPADVTILDILYGRSAFLATRSEAASFGEICENLGHEHGLNVIPMLRPSENSLGKSIGVSTEVLDAASIFSAGMDQLQHDEFERAIAFMEVFGAHSGADVQSLVDDAERARSDGSLFRTMLNLWREHGADDSWLKEFERGPQACLMRGLVSHEFSARISGVVFYDDVLLADFVNSKINITCTAYGQEHQVRRGGVRVHVLAGDFIEKGEAILTVWAERDLGIDLSELDSIVIVQA